MNNKLYVMMPAYNEDENIETLVDEWNKYRSAINLKFNIELIIGIIDDGSIDRSNEICRKLEKKYDNFILIEHEKNMGLGNGVLTAVKYVLEEDKTLSGYMCIMDCDNTQPPEYILDMLADIKNEEQRDKADVVIASRYRNGAEIKGLSSIRKMMSYGARAVYQIILSVPEVRDYTCGYRLYTTEILNRTYTVFNDDIIKERGFTCMAELLYKIYLCGGRFCEIPFELRYDLKLGMSKMKLISTAVGSVKLALKMKKIKAADLENKEAACEEIKL